MKLNKNQSKKQTPFQKFKLIDNGVFNSDYPKGYNLATGMCDSVKVSINVFHENIVEVKKR